MGTDSLFKGCYITCVHNNQSPYGRMVSAYNNIEDAKSHIKYQKEKMAHKGFWSILHIKDLEWISDV